MALNASHWAGGRTNRIWISPISASCDFAWFAFCFFIFQILIVTVVLGHYMLKERPRYALFLALRRFDAFHSSNGGRFLVVYSVIRTSKASHSCSSVCASLFVLVTLVPSELGAF